jgi:hypothetical protein
MLQVEISHAARATTAWQVHLYSFFHLLQIVAEEQRRRFPDQVVAYPPETRSFRIDQVAFGFQLLVLRYSDLSVLIPGLEAFPSTTYPARIVPGGKAGHVLVIDGWSGESTGLLAYAPHVQVQLDGTLKDVEAVAWDLFMNLNVILDATILIRDSRGSVRAGYDAEGWTEIPGLRKAAGSYRLRPLPPRSQGPPDDLNNGLDGGAK